jgi:curved DNA-binding protein
MNYYEILGVDENASQDDIKKAYKKLAMKHHPDRGGDNKKFQEISQAYDTLSDSQKKSQYDAERNGFGNPFGNMGGFGNFGDVFGFHFGPGFASNTRRKNKDLGLRISITFKQSYLGTQVEAQYNTPSGRKRTVIIEVPPGVQSGQVLRFAGLGDDSIPNLQPGNLNVTVMVEADAEWFRRNNDLCKEIEISWLDAMTGCTKEIKCLDGNIMPLKIRPGIQHAQEFASAGRGFRDSNYGRVGALIIIVKIIIPAITDEKTVQKLKEIYAEISNTP